MYGYIYKTTNLVNGKVYVGQHKASCFAEDYKGSGKYITNALKKYGADNFSVVMLSQCNTQEELNTQETYWIDKLNTKDLTIGYNLTTGGQYCPEWSDERKLAQSIRNTGIICIYNGVNMKRISPKALPEFIKEGWKKGVPPFTRSEKFKQKVSATAKTKVAMSKDGVQKWIPKDLVDTYSQDGWNFGWIRTYKAPISNVEPGTGNRKIMHKNTISKLVYESNIPKYVAEGWEMGRPKNVTRTAWNKNKKMPEEVCKKLSVAHIGEKHSQERINKHIAAIKGRIYMNNGVVNKLIPFGEEDLYEKQGWIKGRLN